MLIQQLPHNNVDIIGDVHGEIDSLQRLLQHLGYDQDGNHPKNRLLVFVGDLFDRGPNSWAVFQLVRRLLQSNKALCIMGNHELNLLIADTKPSPEEANAFMPKYKYIPEQKSGNRWFHGLMENMLNKEDKMRFPKHIDNQFVLQTPTQREEIIDCIEKLPLIIETSRLRIVHACWHKPSVESIRNLPSDMTAKEAYNYFLTAITQKYSNTTKDNFDLCLQNENPIKTITSGLERKLFSTEKPYFAGGKQRDTVRVLWWDGVKSETQNSQDFVAYTDSQYVIFGHYWRTRPIHESLPEHIHTPPDKKEIPRVFPKDSSYNWMGPRKNCFCIDYSVGKRYYERFHLANTPTCHSYDLGFLGSYLGAMRVQEQENGSLHFSIVFEDGFTTKPT